MINKTTKKGGEKCQKCKKMVKWVRQTKETGKLYLCDKCYCEAKGMTPEEVFGENYK